MGEATTAEDTEGYQDQLQRAVDYKAAGSNKVWNWGEL